MRPSRWPVRVRLTVLYAVSFLVAGAVLVTVTYVLVSQSLFQPEATARFENLVTRPGVDLPDVSAVRDAIEAYRADTLKSLLTWSLVALAAGLVLAAVLGWAMAGRALRPLQQVTDTARRVADRSLHERIGLTGPDDEVKELADTIDAMLERLDRSFDAQRRFVANASHELRTPLAVNRTLLEVALGEPEVSDDLRRLGPTVLATNERSERLVEGLLTLARSEQTLTDRSPVDLAEVVYAVVEHETPAARAAGIEVTTSLAPAPTLGDGLLLERLVVNLVQNVGRHATPGTTALIRTGHDGDSVFVEVENAGDRLHAHEIDGLFEPFRRGAGRTAEPNGSRGVGLGLSIVRSVAQAHCGRATGSPRAGDGGGLVVRVDLPAHR